MNVIGFDSVCGLGVRRTGGRFLGSMNFFVLVRPSQVLTDNRVKLGLLIGRYRDGSGGVICYTYSEGYSNLISTLSRALGADVARMATALIKDTGDSRVC